MKHLKRKILVITANHWNRDEIGGAYKIATDFALFCAEKEREVHYLCGYKDLPSADVYMESGVKVWRYPSANGMDPSAIQRFLHYTCEIRKVVKKIFSEIEGNRDLVLNGHTPLQYWVFTRFFGKRVPYRRVMSVHSPWPEEFRENRIEEPFFRTAPFYWALRCMESDCYRRSDVIHCDSSFTASLVSGRLSDGAKRRIAVCPGYVDARWFSRQGMPRSEARRNLDRQEWQTNEICFFTLRRHVPRMGLETLVHACRWIRDQLGPARKFRLIIGGDGPLRGELETLVTRLQMRDVIYFSGKVPEDKLPLSYRAADCFVLPTRALECFGLVILEAFACGTPVIATPVGAIPEVLGSFKEESMSGDITSGSLGQAMLNFILQSSQRSEENELVSYARRYEKNSVLERLEKIVLGSEPS